MSKSGEVAAEADAHRREASNYLNSAGKFAARDELGAVLVATLAAAEANLAVADEVRALRMQMREMR